MDEALTALRVLSSSEAEQWVRAALTGSPTGGGDAVLVELDEVHHRPQHDTSAGFHVTITTPDGREVVEYLVATTAQVSGEVSTITHDDLTLRFWQHPADPRLPSLPQACTPASVADWLDQPADSVELQLLAYRPLRRAVLRAGTQRGALYVKVVLPRKGADQARRHRLLGAAGLSPEVVAEPAPGVLVIDSAAGEPLAQVLSRWTHGGDWFDPQRIVDLLDAMPAEVMDLPTREAWTARLDVHARGAEATLPAATAEIAALEAGITAFVDSRLAGPWVPVHGDLYEANLFVDDDRLTMIDVDSAGPGHRVDDLACVLAHAAVLPALSPQHYAGLERWVEQAARVFEVGHDAAALRARVAGVLLTLVAGAPEDQATSRLALAKQWYRHALAATDQ
ncbi:phosphotransferase [Propionibacteriaceae bacterium Y1923]|uniref:phosphotransferase n=1 Tax=Aestuariimicrobium sp. Y1814 TaxID=3418742 RepID=UPI003C26006C